MPDSVQSIGSLQLTVVTADRSHPIGSANLRIHRPDQVWASDATGVLTGQGWLYLVAVLDLFSRRIIGWAMSPILDAPLVYRRSAHGLESTPAHSFSHPPLRSRQPIRQCRFSASLGRARLSRFHRRPGNCYDNAFIESFWSTLKYKLVYHRHFTTRAQARTAIFDYIETFYNRTRLHSRLDYLQPDPLRIQTQIKINPFPHCPRKQCKPTMTLFSASPSKTMPTGKTFDREVA